MKTTKNTPKFLVRVLGIATIIIICLAFVGVGFYQHLFGIKGKSQINNELTEDEQAFEEAKRKVGEINQTIAVFGVDEDGVRTDVIFVVNMNTVTKTLNVISIPRDTKVIWTDKQKRAYKQLTGHSIQVSKLNEMSAYGRINQNVGNIRDFTIDEIENILKVNIDHYIVIDLKAFNKIVEAIGGVDIYVPQDMYYVDQYQGLYIDLKEGMQHLDAKDAEGLVRFRRYPLGDEKRVAVQQAFLKAVAEKVMNQNIMSLANIVRKVFPYIQTDISLSEGLDYLGLIKGFDLNSIHFYIIPGEGDNYEGPSYYYIDEEGLQEMIANIFGEQSNTLVE